MDVNQVSKVTLGERVDSLEKSRIQQEETHNADYRDRLQKLERHMGRVLHEIGVYDDVPVPSMQPSASFYAPMTNKNLYSDPVPYEVGREDQLPMRAKDVVCVAAEDFELAINYIRQHISVTNSSELRDVVRLLTGKDYVAPW